MGNSAVFLNLNLTKIVVVIFVSVSIVAVVVSIVVADVENVVPFFCFFLAVFVAFAVVLVVIVFISLNISLTAAAAMTAIRSSHEVLLRRTTKRQIYELLERQQLDGFDDGFLFYQGQPRPQPTPAGRNYTLYLLKEPCL